MFSFLKEEERKKERFITVISSCKWYNHRFMMDVGEVETSYYLFVTIPRSIFISVPLFIFTILLDQLYTTKKNISFKTESIQPNIQEEKVASEKKTF